MRKYNHKKRISGTQYAKIKSVYPGMFVLFRYRNFKVFDMRNLYSTSEMKKNKINYFSIGR